MTRADISAHTAGRRAIDVPSRAKAAPFGSCCHAFDGQNTRVPSRDTTAGTSVSPASSVTNTAMASAGPIDLSMPRVDSASAAKATITAPAAEAMASPTRSTACTMPLLASSPARSASR